MSILCAQALAGQADREQSGAVAAAESSRREAEAKAKEESDLVHTCQVREKVGTCLVFGVRRGVRTSPQSGMWNVSQHSQSIGAVVAASGEASRILQSTERFIKAFSTQKYPGYFMFGCERRPGSFIRLY